MLVFARSRVAIRHDERRSQTDADLVPSLP